MNACLSYTDLRKPATAPPADDEAMAAALLERLLHQSDVFNIKGRCYRLRDLERILK